VKGERLQGTGDRLRKRPFAALILCAACGVAFAERADRDKEIVVGADKLTADDANRTSTFEGNVVITQGTMRMTAARVTVREDPQRFKYYVAHGAPVTFRQKRDKVDEWVEGYAERAEFDDRNDVLKLFNRAKVKSNQNEITGEFITYDMKRELAEVTGAAPGARVPEGPDKPRVKVIILPPKKGEREFDKTDKSPTPSLKTDPGSQ
jgi:lipopolysaccharide export system protein LptA